LSIVLYTRHAKRDQNPVVKLEHVTRQPYLGLGVSTAFLLTGTFAVNSYIPLFMRAGKGASSTLTAWSVLPLTVGWTIGAIISSRMTDRHSESWIVVLGFLINAPALAIVWFLVHSDSAIGPLFFTFMVVGIGVGMATNAALTLLRAVTETSKMGRVGAAHLFMRNQGFTFGAAIGGTVMLFVINNQIGDVELVRELISASTDTPPPGAERAVQEGFAASIAVGLLSSVLGLLTALRMRTHLAAERLAKRGT